MDFCCSSWEGSLCAWIFPINNSNLELFPLNNILSFFLFNHPLYTQIHTRSPSPVDTNQFEKEFFKLIYSEFLNFEIWSNEKRFQRKKKKKRDCYKYIYIYQISITSITEYSLHVNFFRNWKNISLQLAQSSSRFVPFLEFRSKSINKLQLIPEFEQRKIIYNNHNIISLLSLSILHHTRPDQQFLPKLIQKWFSSKLTPSYENFQNSNTRSHEDT